MACEIIDGKAIASIIKDEVRERVLTLKKRGLYPGLAVIQVGDNSASTVYVNNKIKACEYTGIKSFSYKLKETATQAEALELILELNASKDVSGILLQLPVSKHMNAEELISKIAKEKDVDCFNAHNVGEVFTKGADAFFKPCTPAGIIALLKRTNLAIEGKNVVVLGRSNIVGKPVASLMLGENATVTICHSKTRDLGKVTAAADILIVAIGKAKFITKDMIKQGAVVIDVGMNRDEGGKLCGDVDFKDCFDKAAFMTPVPGGVGPMTIAMLMENTVKAVEIQ